VVVRMVAVVERNSRRRGCVVVEVVVVDVGGGPCRGV